MVSRHGRDTLNHVRREFMKTQSTSAPGLAIRKLPELVERLERCTVPDDIDANDYAEMLTVISGLQVDMASEARNQQALELGRVWAEAVSNIDGADAHNRAQARYNHATAIAERHSIALHHHIRERRARKPGATPVELALRTELRASRVLYRDVANDGTAPLELRSRAWCNLANNLDTHSRWVEAYEAYLEALTLNPRNGNAYGNIAQLLLYRLGDGRGLPGHYVALYSRYRLLAQAHRAETIRIAGVETADRWDALPDLGHGGHESHDGDLNDPYQVWTRQHRLALARVIEGLGSNGDRWDDAHLVSVYVGHELKLPRVYASLNVAKSEYLVARRLVFDAVQQLDAQPETQAAEDTGTYVDTEDGARYDMHRSMLVLAQRAALDILDKLAVAANDHFEVGREPRRVIFRDLWFNGAEGILTKELPSPVQPRSIGGALIALAELSFDLHEDGLYSRAQTLRHAGTHRIVVATDGDDMEHAVGDAHERISTDALIAAALQALTVVRSAYLYFVDLVHDQQEHLEALHGPNTGILPTNLQS